MAFDYEGAIKEGYTDADIAKHLSSKTGFDLEGALKEGYADSDIVKHLVGRDTGITEPAVLADDSTEALSKRILAEGQREVGMENVPDILRGANRGITYPFAKIPEVLAKLTGMNAAPYTDVLTGLAAERAEMQDRLKDQPTARFLAGMGEEAGGLVSTLPFDILTGGIAKSATMLPKASALLNPAVREILSKVPGFAFGMGGRKATTTAADLQDKPALERALKTTAAGLEGMAEGAIIAKLFGIGKTRSFPQRLAIQTPLQTATSTLMTMKETAKEGRFPTADEFAQGVGSGIVWGLFGAAGKRAPKAAPEDMTFQRARDSFRLDLQDFLQTYSEGRWSPAEAEYISKTVEKNELKKAGVETPTADDYFKASRNLSEIIKNIRETATTREGAEPTRKPTTEGAKEDLGRLLPMPERGATLSNPVIAEAIGKSLREKLLPGPEGMDLANKPDFTLTPSRTAAEEIIQAGRPLQLPAPAERSPYSVETAELLNKLKESRALPPPANMGEGFTMQEPEPKTILRKKEPDYTVAEVPEGVIVEHKPQLTRAGAPFQTEATAKNAIQRLNLEDTHVVVPVEGGFGIKNVGKKVDFATRVRQPSAPGGIIAPDQTSGAVGAPIEGKGELPYWLKVSETHSKRADTLSKSSHPNDIAQAKGEREAAANAFRKWRSENPTAVDPRKAIAEAEMEKELQAKRDARRAPIEGKGETGIDTKGSEVPARTSPLTLKVKGFTTNISTNNSSAARSYILEVNDRGITKLNGNVVAISRNRNGAIVAKWQTTGQIPGKDGYVRATKKFYKATLDETPELAKLVPPIEGKGTWTVEYRLKENPDEVLTYQISKSVAPTESAARKIAGPDVYAKGGGRAYNLYETPTEPKEQFAVRKMQEKDRAAGSPWPNRQVTLTHWGKEGITVVDPKFMGTGQAGAEMTRRTVYKGGETDFLNRSSWGAEGYQREPRLSRSRYKGVVNGNDIYDISKNPMKIKYDDLTDYENKIYKLGYKGYYNGNRKAVVMFEPVKVEAVKSGEMALPLQPKVAVPKELKAEADKMVEVGRKLGLKINGVRYSGREIKIDVKTPEGRAEAERIGVPERSIREAIEAEGYLEIVAEHELSGGGKGQAGSTFTYHLGATKVDTRHEFLHCLEAQGLSGRVSHLLTGEHRGITGEKLAYHLEDKLETFIEDTLKGKEPPSPLLPYVKPETAEGRIARREKRTAGIGSPPNERTVISAPGKKDIVVGKITFDDWLGRVNEVLGEQVDKRMMSDARGWYKQLHDIFTPIYGPDAPKIALAMLLSQQNASPTGGFGNVLRAIDIVNGKKKLFTAGLNERGLTAAVQGKVPPGGIGPKLHDFVDSEMGREWRTLYREDPRGRHPAAIDVWAFRDVGFVDEPMLTWLVKEYGPDSIKGLKYAVKYTGETQYEYGVDFYNDLSKYLNERGVDGGGWTASQAQAVGWIVTQLKMGRSPQFVRQIIEGNTRRISIGFGPGKGTVMASKLAGAEIPPAVAQKEIRYLADLAKIKVLDNVTGAGAFLTDLEGCAQVYALSSPESVADFMDMVGYAFQQEMVVASRGLDSGNRMAIDLLSKDLGTVPEANKFFTEFLKHVPVDKKGNPIVLGFSQIKRDGVPGIQFLNFKGNWNEAQIAGIKEAINKTNDLTNYDLGDTYTHKVELKSTSNDWRVDRNGEAYINSLRNRGRLREIKELERRYVPSRFDLAGDGSFKWGGKTQKTVTVKEAPTKVDYAVRVKKDEPLLYSGVDVTDTPKVLKNLRENIKDYRPVVRSGDVGLLQRLWQSPHWLAKKHPEFKKIYDREIKREEDRATMLDKRLKGWESVRNLNKKDLERLKKVIWITEGKKIKSVTEPRFIWKDNEHGREGAKGKLLKDVAGLNLKHYKQIADYLKERGVSQPVIEAYVDLRKHFDRSYAMIMNRMIRMKDVDADTITQYRQEIGNIQNYFPHQWYGNYYFHGLDKEGNLVARIQYYDATAGGYSVRHKGMLEQAKKDYPQVSEWTAPKKSRQLPEEVYEYPIPLEAMEQIINAASARVGKVDPAAGNLFQSAMPEAVSDVMKSRGFGSHMIRRKGILGYEKQNILKVLHDTDSSFSGWLTKMEAAHDFSALMRDIKGFEKPGLLSYTSRYIKDVMSNADRLDRVVDGMRAYFFIKYLGLNLKTGVVNALTQNVITGMPRLSIDVGAAQASRYVKIAGDDLISNITKGKNLSAEENRMLLELHESGVIQDQYAREIKGRIHGRGSQILNGVNNVLGYFMSVSEKFNRASMALTAFRLAKEGKIINKKVLGELGLEKGKPATYEQAIKFAEDVTQDAHFVYSKGNQPEMIRGRMKILRPFYSLASFSHNLLQLWAHMLRQGGRGMSAFALSMMATALFGGIMSIPFIKPLFDAWRKHTGTDPQKEIRDRLPEIAQDVVTYGVPSLFGVNIGGSLEIGNIDQKNPLKFIIGVPYSEIETASRVSSAYQSGEPLRAIEELSPTFLKNPQAAWRLYTKGQHSITGKPINFPGETDARKISALEAVGKSFGFQPLSATKARDASEALEDLQEFVKGKQNKMANQYANAMNRNDEKEMDRIMAELNRWNDKWMAQDKPEFTINLRNALRGRLKATKPPRKFRLLGEKYKEEYQ